MPSLSIRLFPLVLAFAALIPLCGTARAAPAGAPTAAESAIRQVLGAQVTAWNHGDLPGFMQGYLHSPDLIFVGQSAVHGYDNVLARYQKNYGHGEAMGTLAFRDLEVMPVDAAVALVTGHYHLTRTAAGGGDADGIFSLVFKQTRAGWKIVLDHTS